MADPWWERAKARVRRLGFWKWRDPVRKVAQRKRLKARMGREYTRPAFYAVDEAAQPEEKPNG